MYRLLHNFKKCNHKGTFVAYLRHYQHERYTIFHGQTVVNFSKVYGSQKLPGRSCADILAQRCDRLQNGIYWITLGNYIIKKVILHNGQSMLSLSVWATSIQ